MEQRIILLRSLSTKIRGLRKLKGAVTISQGWISSVRQALGMTTLQLARRLGVSQPRITKMESCEKNLKISTMEKIADGLDCEFVYGFVPRTTLQKTIQNQARKKAISILSKVNTNMALEDQLSKNPYVLKDLMDDLMRTKIKQLWDE